MLLGYSDPEDDASGGLATCTRDPKMQPRYAEADVLEHVRAGWPRRRIVELLAGKAASGR